MAVSWWPSQYEEINLEEAPQLFTGRVYISVQQLGIPKVVRVRTVQNGDIN